MKWILERLSEKSTWITVFTVLASVGGVAVAPELEKAIIATGMGIVSLVAIWTKEKK